MKVAVILSGCGVMDGSEIHEATCTLLNLDKQGIEYQCFAPNINQAAVINHLNNKPMPETRNVLAEAEFVMIVELKGEMVERVYATVVDNVDEIVTVGKHVRADEFFKAKSKEELLKSFGAIKVWSGGVAK